MASARIYIEVEPGPVLDYIPDWCEADRKELASRCQTLGDMLRMTAQPVEEVDEYLSEGTA